ESLVGGTRRWAACWPVSTEAATAERGRGVEERGLRRRVSPEAPCAPDGKSYATRSARLAAWRFVDRFGEEVEDPLELFVVLEMNHDPPAAFGGLSDIDLGAHRAAQLLL